MQRLQLWQSIFGEQRSPTAAAGASAAVPYGEVPRLASLPSSVTTSGSSISSTVPAGSAGLLVGATILIYANTANLFDFSVIDRGGDDSTTDKQMKFVEFLKELCDQANCLCQLLPMSHVPLSKRHDLRRVSFLAPSLSVLLDVLAVIHKMIAVFVPFDGTPYCAYSIFFSVWGVIPHLCLCSVRLPKLASARRCFVSTGACARTW
jgi:hypothetical protein